MRTVGVLGGMSAASTSLYVSRLHGLVRQRLGGLHSASLLVRYVDFAPIAAMQEMQRWEQLGLLLNAEAKALERGGADLLLLATNTMHNVAELITDGVGIPFIHIASATARAISRDGHTSPGLMATKYTMEKTFYTDQLRAAPYALRPLIPSAEDRNMTHQIIYDELCKDIVREESRRAYERIAANLASDGADCLILGCTEIGMLLSPSNVTVPVYDTTLIHCDAAIDEAMRES